jgi:hypothetical protein
MVWFWIGGCLAAVGLTAWIRWIGEGWVRKTAAVPLVVWVVSVGLAVFFTLRAYHAVEAADASQKAFLMAKNIGWAMNTTMGGLIGLGLIAVLLLAATLRRKVQGSAVV